jgi:cytoplasmic FMR1 interacting protein
MELDPWEDILAEANEVTALRNFHGRIAVHIIFELVYDFFPNFCYNSTTQRFVRTPFSLVDERQRENPPKVPHVFLYGSKSISHAYAAWMALYSNYVGLEHFEALVEVLGQISLPLVVSEILSSMENKLSKVIAPYVAQLIDGMPASSKLPAMDYGTDGCYGACCGQMVGFPFGVFTTAAFHTHLASYTITLLFVHCRLL